MTLGVDPAGGRGSPGRMVVAQLREVGAGRVVSLRTRAGADVRAWSGRLLPGVRGDLPLPAVRPRRARPRTGRSAREGRGQAVLPGRLAAGARAGMVRLPGGIGYRSIVR